MNKRKCACYTLQLRLKLRIIYVNDEISFISTQKTVSISADVTVPWQIDFVSINEIVSLNVKKRDNYVCISCKDYCHTFLENLFVTAKI